MRPESLDAYPLEALPMTAPRWNVADPAAFCPPLLLSPCGRYSCDDCEALTARGDLTEWPDGFVCPECDAGRVRAERGTDQWDKYAER